jgi:2-polyprenyl-3-methyl-5-hydroxy-6-metoxy-1,4-benzoquinol methylase
VPEFSAKPDRRFDLVISTDVLEHIPEESIDEVLKDIFNYSDQWVFLTICTRELEKYYLME